MQSERRLWNQQSNTHESVNPYNVFRCCFNTNSIRQPCDAVIHSCSAVVSSGTRFSSDSSSSSSSSSSAFTTGSCPGFKSGFGSRDYNTSDAVPIVSSLFQKRWCWRIKQKDIRKHTSLKDCSKLVPVTEIIMLIWWIMNSGSSSTWYGKYATLSARYSICAKLVFWNRITHIQWYCELVTNSVKQRHSI